MRKKNKNPTLTLWGIIGSVYFVLHQKRSIRRDHGKVFFESLRSGEKVAPLPRRPIDLLEMESRFAPQGNLSVVALFYNMLGLYRCVTNL